MFGILWVVEDCEGDKLIVADSWPTTLSLTVG